MTFKDTRYVENTTGSTLFCFSKSNEIHSNSVITNCMDCPNFVRYNGRSSKPGWFFFVKLSFGTETFLCYNLMFVISEFVGTKSRSYETYFSSISDLAV
jgi:hypothetical protein